MKNKISFLRSVTRQSKRDENDHEICISNISKPLEVKEEQGSILVETEGDATSSAIDSFDYKTAVIWKLQENNTIESWERRRLVLDKGILIYYHVNAKIGDDKDQEVVYDTNTASSSSIFDSLFCFYDLFSVTKDEETDTKYEINQPRGVIDIINSNVKLQKLNRNDYASQPTPYLFDISSFKQNWVISFDSLDELNSWYDVCSCLVNRNQFPEKSPIIPPHEYKESFQSVNNVNDVEINQYDQLTTDRNQIVSQIDDSFRPKNSLYKKMAGTFRLNKKSSNIGYHNSSTDKVKNPKGEQTFIESNKHNDYNLRSNNEESKLKSYCISKPVAGATTVQIRDPTEVNEENISYVKWCAAPVSTVDVRGENYIGDGKKIPCPYTLYELIHVDTFNSVVPMQQMATRVELPNLSFDDSSSPKTWQAPDLFISSLSLPTTSTPGEGYILTGYYRMREQTRKILRFITSPEYKEAEGYDELKSEFQNDNLGVIINGVKLWEKWCRDASFDQELQKRMKFIARGDNLREIGVPRWICNYNGKPMLIKRPGVTNFVYTYPELSVIEFDLNLHAFPSLFKRAMSHLLENYFPKMLMTFCYIIEGRNNDELPEVLIGNGLQLCFLEPLHVAEARDVFSGRDTR